ncbi:MAG: PEP-CTERM sorting domain-containing protein [Planctomycetota bacterium]
MKRVLGFVAAAMLVCAGTVSAQMTGFTFTPTFSDDGTKVSNVIAVDFVGRFSGAQILLELTEGTILQELAFGSPVDIAPGSGLAAAAGGLRFDTYLATGDLFSDGPNADGQPNLGGGAVNIRPADARPIWNDPTTISQAFNQPGHLDARDRTNFVIAQIALSSDAQGTFQFFTSANDNVPAPDEIPVYTIRDGMILIPEPASAGLLALVGLALQRRHRRF